MRNRKGQKVAGRDVGSEGNTEEKTERHSVTEIRGDGKAETGGNRASQRDTGKERHEETLRKTNCNREQGSD